MAGHPGGKTERAEGIPLEHRSEFYAYELPQALIAQEPAARRQEARLLRLAPPGSPGSPEPAIADLRIPDIQRLLRPGDLLVLNDTRVVRARLFGTREATGGAVEVLVVGSGGGASQILLGTGGRPRVGEELHFLDAGIRLVLLEALGDGLWIASTDPAGSALQAALEAGGRIPLPPYVKRERAGDPRDALDAARYQTVYARRPGAVAAPTAGLHLTKRLLQELQDGGVRITSVTLHVGPGTFRPVTAEDLRQHPMHVERYEVGEEAAREVAACRARGSRVVPVGTTSVRVLESACDASGRLQPGAGETGLFIHPPYRFRLVDALLTNFHAPRSTLLMLVSALAGRERVLEAYQHAVGAGYRFLSYGDAMFIG